MDTLYKMFSVFSKAKSRETKLKIHRYFSIAANVLVKIRFSLKNAFSRQKGVSSGDSGFIISLTSFPARIRTVYIVVELLFHQKVKADRIVLWLSNEQFQGMQDVPNTLKRQMKRGLEIRFVDDDIKGHKKYYYALKEFPDCNVILVDDDIIYPSFLTETLLEKNREFPTCIICNRGHEIAFENGRIGPYDSWVKEAEYLQKPTHRLCPTQCGGTYFPARCLDREVLNLQALKECAFFSDDLWLKTMAYRKGTKVAYSEGFPQWLYVVRGSQSESLAKVNVGENQNDIAVQNIIKKYNLRFDEAKDDSAV